MSSPGIFCISLDFELHWGVFESKPLDSKGKTYFQNTRKAIPQLLELMQQYGIQATWATVGMLFNRNATEWGNNIPVKIPSYTNRNRSSYQWVKDNQLEQDDPFHFAPELIDNIHSTPGMEIGTHTYSHYYCQEPGQTAEEFKVDLQKAMQLAAERGISLQSLVFPRNQFNQEYLQICAELGIQSVRTNPDTWYWDTSKGDNLAIKLFRTGDAYVEVNQKSVLPLHDINVKSIPALLPASRLYRPYSRNAVLNKLKMQRILHELERAAETNSYYHLWWHPHNLGNNPSECLDELELIFKSYKQLNQKTGMLSLNMHQTRSHLLSLL